MRWGIHTIEDYHEETHGSLPEFYDKLVARAVLAEELGYESFWLTEIVRSHRPTVLEEVRQGLTVVESALFDVTPRLYADLEAALRSVHASGFSSAYTRQISR